ncbi:hypothetical protein [Sinorhizobium meliloti]|uniref:hypothetical protein n=1 Tax=Rhizobium meliloti TaxID=382 RepID=UPI000FDC2AAE|nr:hypothetical protein [Sinorhizobium meliloti]RVG88708.1 hypothetical protein CN219_03825 [Sinorhizobium meliloti]RVI39010.1 hypothetical protein CN197_02410 [Sinorhizobium meliloti]RVI46646.1 hypothetical protein CN196_09260 [Sinorhizobium meliloti]RVJ25647.1 hypothetical protein CN177_13300 [Sinorhizobium meliloti]RVK02274.1 hypothetical protein CN170_08830 [Sinorhizobium meliloti]
MTEEQAIERLRNELRMQKARIRGWMEDNRCTHLRITTDQLMDALDEIEAALVETAGHDIFARRMLWAAASGDSADAEESILSALSRTRSLEDAA